MPGKETKSTVARRARASRPPAGLVYVTRQVHFNAAHRLHNPAFGQKWNIQVIVAPVIPKLIKGNLLDFM